jgi:hypothetical protein
MFIRLDFVCGCSGALYELYLTHHPEVVLAAGDGVFGSSRTETFYIPIKDEYPTATPVPATVASAPTVLMETLFLTVIFEGWHQETSWIIVHKDDPTLVFAEASFDTYRAGVSVTEEIHLPIGGVYIFTIFDFFDDSLENGMLAMTRVDGTIVFSGMGDFESERTVPFSLDSS